MFVASSHCVLEDTETMSVHCHAFFVLLTLLLVYWSLVLTPAGATAGNFISSREMTSRDGCHPKPEPITSQIEAPQHRPSELFRLFFVYQLGLHVQVGQKLDAVGHNVNAVGQDVKEGLQAKSGYSEVGIRRRVDGLVD